MKTRLGRLIAVVGAGAIALSAAAQGPSKLAVGPDSGGYLCPDGRQLYVKSCYNEFPDANCGIVNMHLPMQRGYQVETSSTRSTITSTVAACKVYPVEFRDDGTVGLVLSKSAPPVRETTVADARGNAVENSAWGEVEYIGNTNWIRRIGNMEVEYIGNTYWIRRIGNMEVEYIGNTEWIRRIGNLEVEYIGNTNWIRRIGNMEVEYIGNTEWIKYIGNRQ